MVDTVTLVGVVSVEGQYQYSRIATFRWSCSSPDEKIYLLAINFNGTEFTVHVLWSKTFLNKLKYINMSRRMWF